MKKTALIMLFSICLFPALAISSVLPSKDPTAKDVMIPFPGFNRLISVEEYLNLTPKSYRILTGNKMNLKEKVQLSIGKKMMKKRIQKDGTINIDRIKKHGFFGQWQWHWGGFALGFFLSLLGPIVALFFNDEYKWDRFWTAMKTCVLVWLIAGIIIAASAG